MVGLSDKTLDLQICFSVLNAKTLRDKLIRLMSSIFSNEHMVNPLGKILCVKNKNILVFAIILV